MPWQDMNSYYYIVSRLPILMHHAPIYKPTHRGSRLFDETLAATPCARSVGISDIFSRLLLSATWTCRYNRICRVSAAMMITTTSIRESPFMQVQIYLRMMTSLRAADT